MDPKRQKLEQQQHQETRPLGGEQELRGEAHREFATVDDLLREDAALTVPPEALAHKVAQSVAALPARSGSWWSRWFGGSGKR
jgi:hypothetical protein